MVNDVTGMSGEGQDGGAGTELSLLSETTQQTHKTSKVTVFKTGHPTGKEIDT